MSEKVVLDWKPNKVCATHKRGDVPNVNLKMRKNKVTIAAFSDLHFGADAFDKTMFESHLAYAVENDAYIILAGDLWEIALPSRIEESVWEQVLTPAEQFEMAKYYFYPIKDRIILSVSGNHDARVWKKTGFDLAKKFAEELGCFYSRNGSYAFLNVGTQTYKTVTFHGARSGKNYFTEMENRLAAFDETDIMFMGNNHVLDRKPVCKVRVVDGLEQTIWVWLVRTGSFIREPEYGRAAGYNPTLIGSPFVDLYGDKRLIKIDTDGELNFE